MQLASDRSLLRSVTVYLTLDATGNCSGVWGTPSTTGILSIALPATSVGKPVAYWLLT